MSDTQRPNAFVGAMLNPEEQAMADAIQRRQRGGQLLSLSTVPQLNQLGASELGTAERRATGIAGLSRSRRQREQQLADIQSQRDFITGEREATEAYRTSEAAKARLDRSTERGLDRALQQQENERTRGFQGSEAAKSRLFQGTQRGLDRAMRQQAAERGYEWQEGRDRQNFENQMVMQEMRQEYGEEQANLLFERQRQMAREGREFSGVEAARQRDFADRQARVAREYQDEVREMEQKYDMSRFQAQEAAYLKRQDEAFKLKIREMMAGEGLKIAAAMNPNDFINKYELGSRMSENYYRAMMEAADPDPSFFTPWREGWNADFNPFSSDWWSEPYDRSYNRKF